MYYPQWSYFFFYPTGFDTIGGLFSSF